jgi:hypothetical protein
MKKFLGLFVLIGLMGMMGAAARAGTVNLQNTGPCLDAYYCSNVNNDAALNIAVITYSPHYGRLTAIIDNVVWDSGLYALGSFNGTEPTSFVVNATLYDNAGNAMTVSVDWTGGEVTGKCHQQGRVCVYPHAPVYITSGTLVTQ